MHYRFTDEALKEQDGKKIPLRLEIGGPVIGEATLRYDSDTGELKTEMRIDDPKIAAFLGQDASAIVFKKES